MEFCDPVIIQKKYQCPLIVETEKKPEPECPPPPYADLGKKARDLFGQGYYNGLIKLDMKTKSACGIAFNTGGQSNNESGEVFATFETKYENKNQGMSFVEKCNSDRCVGVEISCQDKLLQGLKLGTEITLFNDVKERPVVLKAAYNNEYVALNYDFNIKSSGSVMKGAAVIGFKGLFAGCQAAFDFADSRISENNFAIDLCKRNTHIHANVNNGDEYGVTIFQKWTNKLENGLELSWSAGSKQIKSGIALKYNFHPDMTLRGKIHDSGIIGLGYQLRLRQGINLYLSQQIDTSNFDGGNHQFGLAVEFET